ncbi:MAG: ABC transporter permease [Actinomycetaceae bacterium]|nr:ABC transporter permease [Actinomycetaceae bacterium]
MSRLRSAVAVSWSSSMAFATVGTAVTTVLIVPMLSVAFAVMLGADLAAPDLARTGYAAAIVSWIVGIMSGIVSAVATDRTLGIYALVHQYRLIDPAYWLAKAAVPSVLSFLTGATSIGVVFVLSGDTALLARVVVLALLAIIVGIGLGIAAAGVGVALPDPYLGATILATFLPLFTGVVVPLDVAPVWLRALSFGVPGAGLVSSVSGIEAIAVLRDFAVTVVYIAVGLAMTRRACALLRRGRHFHTL